MFVKYTAAGNRITWVVVAERTERQRASVKNNARKQEAGGQRWTAPVDMKEAAKTLKELEELTILGCPSGMS